jgi:hypothetical protein
VQHRNKFDGSLRDTMLSLPNRGLGVSAVVLLLAALEPKMASITSLAMESRLGWSLGSTGAQSLVLVVTMSSLFWLRFSFWRAHTGGLAAAFLAAALVFTTLWEAWVLAFLYSKLPTLPTSSMHSTNWLGALAGLLFACGLFLSGLLPRWVPSLSIVSVVLTAGSYLRTSFAPGASMFAQMIGSRLHAAGTLFDLVFLLAVAAICLSSQGGARVEQTNRETASR